jgi:type IV secretory pathway VirB3-like protein
MNIQIELNQFFYPFVSTIFHYKVHLLVFHNQKMIHLMFKSYKKVES